MAIRLMVWNIQFFSLKKIHDIHNKETCLQSVIRLGCILSNINQCQPDIFVLIEQLSSRGTVGTLIEGNGKIAALRLLFELRGLQPQKNWYLVPPLKLAPQTPVNELEDGHQDIAGENNYTEAISVFFSGNSLNFIGPYIWPNNNLSDQQKVAVPNNGFYQPSPYPGYWYNWFPANNCYAGQWEFRNVNNQLINFPNDANRRPFYTKFNDNQGRIINLFSIHTSPSSSREAVAKLCEVEEIKRGPQANEVIVVAGDFNLDPRGSVNIADSQYFSQLNSDLKLQTNFPNQPTMLRQNGRSTTLIPKNRNPGSGYQTEGFYRKNEILDNILTKYGTNAGAPSNAQVIDQVYGVPFTTDMNADPLVFFNQYTESKNQSLTLTSKGAELFHDFLNYGHIGPRSGVSDHMALVIDI